MKSAHLTDMMADMYDHILITQAMVFELCKKNDMAKSEVAKLIDKFVKIRESPSNIRDKVLHNHDIVYKEIK